MKISVTEFIATGRRRLAINLTTCRKEKKPARENQVRKIFRAYTFLGNKIEGEARNGFKRAVQFGSQNCPIRAIVLSEKYVSMLYCTVVIALDVVVNQLLYYAPKIKIILQGAT